MVQFNLFTPGAMRPIAGDCTRSSSSRLPAKEWHTVRPTATSSLILIKYLWRRWHRYAKKSRKKMCILIIIFLVVACVLIGPMLMDAGSGS